MNGLRWLLFASVLVLAAATLAGMAWLWGEVEYTRIDSPNGNHVAVVTYRRYRSLWVGFPGQAGDKSGFVRIKGKDGTNYGRIPVPFVWLVRELQWAPDGAEMKLVGRWDFPKREYRWSTPSRERKRRAW